MRKPYNLTLRFSILCALTLVGFGTITNLLVTDLLERNMLRRTEQLVAAIVVQAVRNEFLAAEITRPKTGADYEQFSTKVKRLSFGPYVERIKIWNRDYKVVWSDDQDIVGKQYSDNMELRLALTGSIISDFSGLKKAEHHSEQQHAQLLELYVPIRFKDGGEISGVFEIYLNPAQLQADIIHQKKTIWIWSALAFAAIYCILFSIVWRAARRIDRQHQAIDDSEERYRSLVESAQDGIVAINRSSQIVLFNQAAEKIFNCTAQEMFGKSISCLIPDVSKAKHLSGVVQFHDSGEFAVPQSVREYQGQRSDGELLLLEMSFSTAQLGQEWVVTAILRDITERKAIEKQLILAEKQASVSLIAGSIGHEIGNSISGLLGLGELLKRRPDDQELAAKCAEAMISQSERYHLYAKNLLSLSKPTKPYMRRLDLNALLERVTDMLTTSGLFKAFTVEMKLEENVPLIRGDEHLLEQVIRNLEINAIHAMESRGVLTLRTESTSDQDNVELTITDTGCGIDQEHIQSVFLPFFTTKEDGKGTGLGMYIVKQIVEQHSGMIDIQSSIGIGTTVKVTLPVDAGG